MFYMISFKGTAIIYWVMNELCSTNTRCIERARLARSQGLTLAEYDKLHREDYIHTIGNKTYDFYAIAKEIVSDREKLNKAFGDAWNKVVGKNL